MTSFSRSVTRSVAPATPSTPVGQTVAKPKPTPGAWRHPQFDEITRRQHARTFSEQNATAALVNTVYLVSTFIIPSFASGWRIFSPIFHLTRSMSPYDFYVMLAVRLVLLYSIGIQFWPLFKPKDDLSDIPLTPSQRAAMGLDPNIRTPQTPDSSYVTPPRYSRSTPRSSMSNNSGRKLSQSPLSGSPISGSPVGRSNSPFSPSSPLLHKAVGGGAQRRLFGTGQSPLSTSYFGESSASNTPGTPTPAPAPSKASVGLNNKWLYDKGRGSPGRSLFA
ncbi:uncharacterized protein BDZ99DRAFT_137234 [Mytilinidion resinicola]|uniref:Nuclear pore complex component n=1 Tax=Mytilinidion resinicola TaxID=574789 RepID=A0A6A6Z6Q2_9PEZI|nr:uncharacterized protein BDZ99DRAFT_137234 [Mytilinidion resinicola]KAF2816488.1 hypothetical protein BDZ99DRAFT_137234 [Mytilinidion resinicola]